MLVKPYVRRKRDGDASPPSLVMKIVLKESGAYELRNFSVLKLRELEAYHSNVHFPRKWHLSKDEQMLSLE